MGALVPLSQDTGQPQPLLSNPCNQRRPSRTTDEAGSEEHAAAGDTAASPQEPGMQEPGASWRRRSSCPSCGAGGSRRQKGCAAAHRGGFVWEELGKRDFFFPFPPGRRAAPLQLRTPAESICPKPGAERGGRNLPVDQKAVQARSRHSRQLRFR